MKVSSVFGNMFIVIAFIFLISSAAGLALNRPVLFSYAISESMEPTIGVGDLFFINPFSKGGVGDIVVFRMGDMYVVHRVYAMEGGAYITKGDNNIATDQQGGKNPPISEEDVIGSVVTFSGSPITMPKAGAVIDALHSNSLILAGILISLAFVAFGKSEKKKKDRKKVKVSAGLFYGVASSILILAVVISTMLSWGSLSFSYASTLAGNQQDGWYLPGTTFEKTMTFENGAKYPMVFFFDREQGIKGEEMSYIGPGESRSIVFDVNVPEDTRIYRDGVEVYAYLPLLPLSVTEELYSISPYMPLAVQIASILVLLSVLYMLSGMREEYIVLRKRKRRLKI
ncbi:signal peptidase I [Geoglobus sp.]